MSQTQLSQISLNYLAAIVAAGANPHYMTGAEGQELLNAGLIIADPNQPGPVPGSCRVALSDVGRQFVQAQTAAAATASHKVKPVVSAVTAGIAIPPSKPRASRNSNLTPKKAIYPFEQLEIMQSFHIAATADNPAPTKKMVSNLSAAHARFAIPVVDPAGQPVMHTVLNRRTKQHETKVKTALTRKFICREVDASDPCGPGCRVFRVPLDFQG